MNRCEAKEFIPLIQAWANGRIIQLKTTSNPGQWTDAPDDIAWNSLPQNYRVKPEPKLRPWKPEEVPLLTLARWKQRFVSHVGFVTTIVSKSPEGIWLGGASIPTTNPE
jgi:hypothetical protein